MKNRDFNPFIEAVREGKWVIPGDFKPTAEQCNKIAMESARNIGLWGWESYCYFINNHWTPNIDTPKDKAVDKDFARKHSKHRFLTSFQYWLGTEYNTLPTDSGQMTERARRYLVEYPEAFSKLEKKREEKEIVFIDASEVINADRFERVLGQIENGEFPSGRGCHITDEEFARVVKDAFKTVLRPGNEIWEYLNNEWRGRVVPKDDAESAYNKARIEGLHIIVFDPGRCM